LNICSDDATVVVPRFGMLMAVRNLTERVEVLEMKVGSLEELPARVAAVESQIVQLRTEMRGEFSAVRQEMRDLGGTLRTDMRALNDETRADMRALNEETLAQMRTFHEEALDRIAKIGEGKRPPRNRRR
jgi:hypothetical protein